MGHAVDDPVMGRALAVVDRVRDRREAAELAAGSDPVPQPPAPAPCPDCPDPQPAIDLAVTMDDDADVATWVAYLRAGEPSPDDAWSVGAWHPAPASLAVLEADCGELGGAKWARGALPDPVASAYVALTVPPAWSTSTWRAALWA